MGSGADATSIIEGLTTKIYFYPPVKIEEVTDLNTYGKAMFSQFPHLILFTSPLQ